MRFFLGDQPDTSILLQSCRIEVWMPFVLSVKRITSNWKLEATDLILNWLLGCNGDELTLHHLMFRYI